MAARPQPPARPIALPHVLAAAIVIAILLAPVYLTDGTWGPDWTVHLWAMWAQGAHISAGGPSFFTNTDALGVMYPLYAFYGGTLYVLGGALSAVLGGHGVAAYALTWTLGFAMAYGGLLWLSLQAGLRGWLAHAAPLIYLTSAYYLTNAYARGAWPELMATSAMPLMLASGLSLLHAERLRVLPAATFVGATVIFGGSHNITLEWGALVFAALAVVALVALPEHGRELPRRRLVWIALLGALGMAVNAWFLFPDLVYAGRTSASAVPNQFSRLASDYFDAPGIVFDPFRRMPSESTTPSLYTNLPVFALVWVLVAAVAGIRSRAAGLWRRLAIGIVVVGTVLMGLLLISWPWNHLPKALTYIQFTYRLESYIVLLIALLCIVGLRMMRDRVAEPSAPQSRLLVALAAVLALGGILAIWQTWTTPSPAGATRKAALTSTTKVPPAWYDGGSYHDATGPAIQVSPDRRIGFHPELAHHDRLVQDVLLPGGTAPIGTNLATGPYFATIGPVRVIGRDKSGLAVIQRTDGGTTPATVRLTIGPASTPVILLGRWVTRLAILAIIALLIGFRVGALGAPRPARGGAASEASLPSGAPDPIG